MALPNFHFPNLSVAKMLTSLLAIALFVFVAVAAVSGFLVYQIVRPQRVAASYDLSVMMGHPVTLSFLSVRPYLDGSPEQFLVFGLLFLDLIEP